MPSDSYTNFIKNCDYYEVVALTNVFAIGHFIVVYLVTWPIIASDDGGDFTLIQTSLLFSFKCQLVSITVT